MNLKTAISIALLLAAAAPAADGAERRIGLEDIPSMAMSGSPLAAILDGGLDMAEAERDLSRRWTNPSLSWEMEEIGDADMRSREWVVALEKEFALPWSYARSRAGSDLRLSSARLRYESSRRRLISHLRHGYVTLSLLDVEAGILGAFEDIVEGAAGVIAERKSEGTASGIEKRLIDMSLLSVRARIVESRAERRRVMEEWKTAMGIPAGDSVVLSSRLELTSDWLGAGTVASSGSSDVEARRLAAEALREDIGLEKGGILPSISIAGGYKIVDDELSGFVVGLSIPIPLLNRNSGGVDRAAAEHRMASAELDLYETSRERLISRLTRTAREESALLERYHGDFSRISDHVSDLAVSYGEGWIDLGDFLEGIQTYAGAIEGYFDMLEDYHDIVFELEELTEREIFAPGPAREEDTGS